MTSIDDRLSILLPMPEATAKELGLEFTIGQEAILSGVDPDDPDAEPTIILDAFAQGLSIVKVAGHGPLLVEILRHLADEAERAWGAEQKKRQEAAT